MAVPEKKPSRKARGRSADNPLSDQQVDLIKSLRNEAFAVKDCFTRYSIQSIGFVVLALAFIVRFQVDSMFMTMTILPAMILLAAIGRMGTHKYAASSRLLGYELHLERTSRLSKDAHYEWKREWGDLGWEEAMRAWRVVQATVYERVYVCPPDCPDLMKRMKKIKRVNWFEAILPRQLYWRWKQDEFRPEFEQEKKSHQPLWFMPKSLFAVKDAAYYPGGYLGTMMHVVQATMAMCLFLLLLTPILTFIRSDGSTLIVIGLVLYAVLFVGVTVILLVHSMQLYRRQQVIEIGMLSIHSCAVLWHAIVVAHFRAIKTLEQKTDGIQNYDGYTNALSLQAVDLAENIVFIHEWMKPNRGNRPPNKRLQPI